MVFRLYVGVEMDVLFSFCARRCTYFVGERVGF